jgi:phage terminase large subunit-like protein
LILAGRGWGKTRTGAEASAWFGQSAPGSRIAVVAPTFADARDTCVEGDSGLLSVIPSVCVENWNRSLGELILANGTRFKLFGAESPERLRGPQHHFAWCDELAAWEYADAWDQLVFGLRLGPQPRAIVTTTPRPKDIIRDLVKAPGTIITTGSTFDNAANLSASALTQMRRRYEGTRLGRQELNAELLFDVPGALWTLAMLDGQRATLQYDEAVGVIAIYRGRAIPMQRVVVAVDPSGTRGEAAAKAAGKSAGDDVGIVAAGLGTDGRGYVLEDASCNLSPEGWARRAVTLYRKLGADRIVAERNFGGAMVESVIRAVDPDVAYKEVTASRGKIARAEPVAAYYEQGRVSHCGSFADLEDQLCKMTPAGYVGKGSPDRADGAVWALTELMGAEVYIYDPNAFA